MNINYKCINNIDFNKINIINIKQTYIFYEYFKILNSKKNEIEIYLNKWDKYKKYTNLYEKVLYKNNNTKPISRSFFKLLEINKKFNLVNNKTDTYYFSNNAEGPGGFIEALHYIRNNTLDFYFSYTLNPTTYKIPNWDRLQYKINNKNMILSYKDLYNINHIKEIISKFEVNKSDLVTCDGGFDFSTNFTIQEQMSYKIILSEIILCLGCNKIGKNSVIKIFDIFTIFTVKLLYIISNFYKEINIFKPLTSRTANSEKYLICKGFLGCDVKIINKLLILLNNINLINYNIDIENITVNNNFILFLDKVNYIFMNSQIKCIDDTISIINSKEFDKNKCIKKQINYANEWYDNYL